MNFILWSFISVNELLKTKEELTKDRDEKLSEIVELRQSLVEAATKQVNHHAYIPSSTLLFDFVQVHLVDSTGLGYNLVSLKFKTK